MNYKFNSKITKSEAQILDFGFVTKDEISPYNRIQTSLYNIWLSQRNYGKTRIFTKEELKRNENGT